MKSIFILTVFFMTTQLLVAQEKSMQHYISKDKTALIANFTPYSTYHKLDTATTNKFNVSQMIAPLLLGMAGGEVSEDKISKIQEQLQNTEKIGIDIQKEVYIWLQNPEDPDNKLYKGESNPMTVNLVLPITDADKFRSFLDELFGEEKTKKMIPSDGAMNLIHDLTLLNWNKDRLILAKSTIKQSFFDDEASYNERITNILTQHANAVSKVDVATSIAKDADYQKHLHKDSDFDFWLNYKTMMPSSNDFPPQARELFESIMEFATDMKLGGNGFLKKGEGQFLMEMYTNDAMSRVLAESYKLKPNKDFFKYINSSNLIGLYSIAMSPEGFISSYGTEIYKVLEKTKEGTLLTNFLDIIDIFVDEEEIYTLLKGDMLIAVTDVKVFEKESVDYEFNEKTDKWDEVKSMKKQPLPLAVMMMSYGSEENIMKFVKLASNSGVISKKDEGVWIVGGVKEETGFDLYIIVKDGVFMVTNDEAIPANLKSGFPKDKQLDSKETKNITDYVQYGFIDVDNLAKTGKRVSEEMNVELPADISMFEKTFNRLEFNTSRPKGNETTSEFLLKMTDSNANVLQSLFDVGMKMGSLFSKSASGGVMEEKAPDDGTKKL
jgi:hypothetical protein